MSFAVVLLSGTELRKSSSKKQVNIHDNKSETTTKFRILPSVKDSVTTLFAHRAMHCSLVWRHAYSSLACISMSSGSPFLMMPIICKTLHPIAIGTTQQKMNIIKKNVPPPSLGSSSSSKAVPAAGGAFCWYSRHRAGQSRFQPCAMPAAGQPSLAGQVF